MLLAASESAVTKKPRLRLTTRRSSSVSPLGSFHSWMSRLMLISCGIQWLAQAARYFSQAHLYLNGTSWLTSALELMTLLSSTVTRRKASPAGARSSVPALGGTKPWVGCTASSSYLSIAPASLSLVLVGAKRLRQHERLQAGCFGRRRRVVEFRPVFAGDLPLDGLALRRSGRGHFVRRDVEVPVGAGDRQPFAVTRVPAEELARREILRLPEVERAEGEKAPAGHHHRIQPGAARRRPQRQEERPGESSAGERDHWHASQSGLSTAQNLASSAADSASLPPGAGTALSCPALEVDFSAWVAPIARR